MRFKACPFFENRKNIDSSLQKVIAFLRESRERHQNCWRYSLRDLPGKNQAADYKKHKTKQLFIWN